MSNLSEAKSDLWDQIVKLGKSDPIIHMSMDLLNNGMLEDKENLLMLIVVKQHEYITNLEEQNHNLRADHYLKKSAQHKEQQDAI